MTLIDSYLNRDIFWIESLLLSISIRLSFQLHFGLSYIYFTRIDGSKTYITESPAKAILMHYLPSIQGFRLLYGSAVPYCHNKVFYMPYEDNPYVPAASFLFTRKRYFFDESERFWKMEFSTKAIGNEKACRCCLFTHSPFPVGCDGWN